MSPYRIHHSTSSTYALRRLPPHAQRTIENALAAIARSAISSGASPSDDDVQFAGGMQLSGAWVAWSLDHDERVLSVLSVEPDAETERISPLPFAA